MISGLVNYGMTELNKPVRRRTRSAYSLLYINQARKIVVELTPGDLLTFRELGRRARWHLPIESAFRIAVHRTAAAAQKRGGKRRKVAS